MSQTIIIARLPSRSLAERLWYRAIRSFQAFTRDAIAAQRLIRERDQLAELGDAALKDIGLTQADVWAELRKPVWRR